MRPHINNIDQIHFSLDKCENMADTTMVVCFWEVKAEYRAEKCLGFIIVWRGKCGQIQCGCSVIENKV